jgi:hypothetical protein
VAFGETKILTSAERSAMSILFSEFEGGKFDWQSMRWQKNG